MAAPSAKTMSPEKFDPFHIYTTSYKFVYNHPIGVDVLIPKIRKNGKLPLIVRFHGGFLVTGASMFPMFFTNWILELATTYSAAIVSADYQLLPEANGHAILADIHDLWAWIRGGKLQTFLNEQHTSNTVGTTAPEIDLGHTLVVGDSSGGYLAFQSALTQPAGTIQAVLGLYPQLDVASEFYNTRFEKPLFGMPMLPASVLDAHVGSSQGVVVSSALPPNRVDLACAIVQNGRVLEFLGSDEELLPLEVVKKVKSVPPTCILHGKDDSAVPIAGSELYIEALKTKHPNVPVRLDVQPGEHAFDGEATLDAEWLREDVGFVTKYWLQ